MSLQTLSTVATPSASKKATRTHSAIGLAAGLALAGLAQTAAAATIVTNYEFLGANFEVAGVDPTVLVIDPLEPLDPPEPFEAEALMGFDASFNGVDGALYDPELPGFEAADPAHMFSTNQFGVSYDNHLVTSWVDDGSTPYPASFVSFTVTNNTGHSFEDFVATLDLALNMFVPAAGLEDLSEGAFTAPFVAGNGVGNNDALFDDGESFVVTFFLHSENNAPPGAVQVLPCSQRCTIPDTDFEPGVYMSASIAPVPVPLPAAAWLLLSGVGLVGATARRRRQA